MKKFLALSLLVVTGQAMAAVDAAVTTAISGGVADAAVIGGAILALVVGIAIFRHMRGVK